MDADKNMYHLKEDFRLFMTKIDLLDLMVKKKYIFQKNLELKYMIGKLNTF